MAQPITADHLPSCDDIILEARGSTLIIQLNRPERANALNESLIEGLRRLWPAVAADTAVRAVVVTGAGTAFCAGADISMLAGERVAAGPTAAQELSFIPGPRLDVPVIAAVNGVCAGGGLHFVADADIAICAESARFIDPHVTVGQVSGLEPVELLLKMRRDQVVRMALLGRSEVVDAATAMEAGLVSEVLPSDHLLQRAVELGDQIATGSREAIRQTRAAIRDFEAELLRPHLDRGWRRVQDHWAHPDSTEGPTAFSEKRTPRWAEGVE